MVKFDNTFPNNPIKIGQNALENDNIIGLAKETDIWFHLKALPSCHLIISNSKEYPITGDMITFCAKLVKANTKYRNYAKLKVIYTEIKNVKKTDVAGKVIVKKEKNIVV